MDVLTLLHTATAAGLKISDLGDQLRIRGPKAAEPVVHQLMVHKHDILVELKKRAGWNPETAELIVWFLDEGQHRIPDEPFNFTPWKHCVDPKRCMESILFDISLEPGKTRLRHGTFRADLRRLKELFGEETNS